MQEFIKECPVISVKGNKVILGPPGKAAPFRGQMTRAKYRKLNNYIRDFKKKHGRAPTQKELGAVAAFLIPGILSLLPVLAVAGIGIGGAYLASTAIKKMRPFLTGFVPIGITGVGLWGYSQVKPWLKPVAEEYKTEREFRTALARQKMVDTAVVIAAGGGALYGIYLWVREYGLLKERDKIEKESVGSKETPGRTFTASEKSQMRKVADLLKTGDITISVPSVYVEQWYGAYWEAFTLRIEFKLTNKSPYTLPYIYLEIEDVDIGYTAVSKPVAWDIEPGETVGISASWEATEWKLNTNLPYGVPGEALLRIRLGLESGQYFMSRQFHFTTILTPHLEKYYSKRHPTYIPRQRED